MSHKLVCVVSAMRMCHNTHPPDHNTSHFVASLPFALHSCVDRFNDIVQCPRIILLAQVNVLIFKKEKGLRHL